MGLFSKLMSKRAGSDETHTADQGEYQSRAAEESTAASATGKRKAVRKSKAPDPALPEKKRARRRLIGAVALALAAAIGLPMIFDSEPKINIDAIDIQIPSKDKTLAANATDGSASGADASAVTSASRKQALPDETDTVEEIVPSPSGSVPDTEKNPAANLTKSKEKETEKELAHAGQEKVASTTQPKTEGKVAGAATENQSKPAVQSDLKSEVKPKPEVKSETKLETKPESKTAAVTKTETKPDNKAGSKTEINDAETARALAILEGRPVAKNTVPEKAGKLSLQVAALATQEKVDELRARLNTAGFQTYTQKVATTSGDKIRVRVGPFASKEEADKARAKLVKMGLNGTLVSQ